MLVTFDDEGRVMMTADTPPLSSLAELEKTLQDARQLYLITGSDASDIWVEDPETDKPIPRLRPVLVGEFDSYDLSPEQIATFPDMPATTVMVQGPGLNGTTEHAGGPWPVRFLAPGEYTLAVEPFPYRRRIFRFTVRNEVKK